MDSIVALIIGLTIVFMSLPIAENALSNGYTVTKAHEVASQGYQITLAADQYSKANYSALLTSTAGGPQTIPISALVATGYLPSSFSAVDAYGQTWQVSFYQPAANDLDVLVNATGAPFPNQAALASLAAQMGARGGFQPVSGPGLYAADAGDAVGAFGGWNVPVANFGIAAAPGTPADFLYYNSGTLSSTYLYRVAVPGNPQVNTMQTNLNAGSNNVTNAGTVQFSTTASVGTITQGAPCAPNGEIGTNSAGTGQLMVCQGGSWQPQGASVTNFALIGFGPAGANLGWWDMCSLGGFDSYQQSVVWVQTVAGPNTQGQYDWYGEVRNNVDYGPAAMCFDIS